jgi:hyperosmotically inducible protein
MTGLKLANSFLTAPWKLWEVALCRGECNLPHAGEWEITYALLNRKALHGEAGRFSSWHRTGSGWGWKGKLKNMKILNAIKSFFLMACLAGGVIAVTVGCASEDRTHETSGESVNDAMITSHVNDALAATSDYKFSDVQVNTFKRRVQLSGFVDTGAHKDQAERVAKEIEGVKDVINNITVK